jgi:microcystin degradation protein MlrC
MDGSWLRELRSRVGPRLPVVGTLDLHANLTEAMVRATNALVAYRTNPHLDQRERGQEAARLLGRMLRGEIRPTQEAAFPALAINIERHSTDASPCRECYEALVDMLADHRVLSASLLLGFPYADVRQMGASVLVVTDDVPDLARQLADDFAEYLMLRRRSFVGELIAVDAALDRAFAARGPVLLLDMGDNVGGGAPGDGTVLLSALVRRGVKAFVALYDPAAVGEALQAGIGATFDTRLGGKTDALHGDPVSATVRVRGIYDGRFHEPAARHGGRSDYDMGQTIVFELSTGQTVMATSKRVAPVSLRQLTTCHVDPGAFDVIVAKGVHAPVAAYAPVCPTLIRASTPGVTTADMTKLTYAHRRRPLFPFEER